uniref:COMM domain-containing protein n=1 Tax=Musa acuminata subsp. malaccensis TaxID=214687 RepID=A0A804IYE6_MUSAM|nr:PREDICTED: protein FAR1-RELATED SEQUENCE 3-like isoform X3 [Musa acuminata subsp. malaccensis]
MLIRRCVYENISKDEIQKLFPPEVLPELQRLLTLLLQKFQREWREDVLKDQVSLPRPKAMTCNVVNQNQDSVEHVAVMNLKLQGDTQSSSGETQVKFQLARDTLETMLKSMYFIRDPMSSGDATSNGPGQEQGTAETALT